MTDHTREPQYQPCVEHRDTSGPETMGLMASYSWHVDPKRLTFVLSRYKFVAKMLAGRKRVLEVGCADAFGTRVVLQETGSVTAIDFDPVFVEDVRSRPSERWPIEVRLHDILEGPVEGAFDGAYSLDVLEHIPVEREDAYARNIAGSLGPRGVLVVGTPSLHSQVHASAPSKAGHVNCKDGPGLRRLMEAHFHYVFVFSMNDEVVHTGFTPMAQYLFALCCEKKEQR